MTVMTMRAETETKRRVCAIQNEGGKFQEKWTDEFFFVENSNPIEDTCVKLRAQ